MSFTREFLADLEPDPNEVVIERKTGRPALIHLGFEVGTGEPVEIPLRHLAITGQTQESGKTTTLEALVTRSGVTALAFVTKRGETSFADGRRISPYFRDRADWQFVTSIIDATLQEKNKFLRPWIMKICRTTHTLADVQAKVREALRTARGIHEGVYTQLDAYLDLIVPEITRSPLAKQLDLKPGLNVMDVSGSPVPMQMLFVQSALDWVNEHATKTVVLIPEAWEFVPETKGSPAKGSAVALVRKGAGIGNYIWVDSQDMAGVDKTILRGCAVWLIGVQREANEIRRNLANIPASIKRPSAAEVAMLSKGQFYACWGAHAVKVYVRPAWMAASEAQAIALGIRPVESVKAPQPAPGRNDAVNPEEVQRLLRENGALRARVADLEAKLEASTGVVERPTPPSRPRPRPPSSEPLRAGSDVDESLYQAIKRRLLEELPNEPKVLHLVTEQRELLVDVQRVTINVTGDTLPGRLARLIAEGFFDEARTGSAAYTELQRRGFPCAKPNVYREADKLAANGFLTKEADGYRAVGWNESQRRRTMKLMIPARRSRNRPPTAATPSLGPYTGARHRAVLPGGEPPASPSSLKTSFVTSQAASPSSLGHGGGVEGYDVVD